MPIPFLLLGAAVGAGVLGAGGHMVAKDTNEEAQRISRKAERMYEDEKKELEKAKKNADEALLNLFYTKQKVFNGTIKKFVTAQERVKNVQLKEISNEIPEFAIGQQEILQLQEMSNIYNSVVLNSATGAATAMMVVAASGSVPLMTSGLSVAGTMLAWGDFAGATYLAGSAIGAGLAATPLAAIAAPVVLFTGISASLKADENLEKAQSMLAEAKKAIAEMEISLTECEMIQMTAETFNSQIERLETLILPCVEKFDNLTKEKCRALNREKLYANDFLREELNLVSVTRSLIGALKAHIDMPILKEGKVLEHALETGSELWEKASPLLEEMDIAIAEFKADFNMPSTPKPTKDKSKEDDKQKAIYTSTVEVENFVMMNSEVPDDIMDQYYRKPVEYMKVVREIKDGCRPALAVCMFLLNKRKEGFMDWSYNDRLTESVLCKFFGIPIPYTDIKESDLPPIKEYMELGNKHKAYLTNSIVEKQYEVAQQGDVQTRLHVDLAAGTYELEFISTGARIKNTDFKSVLG